MPKKGKGARCSGVIPYNSDAFLNLPPRGLGPSCLGRYRPWLTLRLPVMPRPHPRLRTLPLPPPKGLPRFPALTREPRRFKSVLMSRFAPLWSRGVLRPDPSLALVTGKKRFTQETRSGKEKAVQHEIFMWTKFGTSWGRRWG